MNKKQTLRITGYVAAAMVITALPALAQTPDTSGPVCNALAMLAPPATRIGLAVVALIAALFQMWQEQSNPMTWVKKHFGTFAFCVLFMGGPSVVVQILGNSATCPTYH